MATFGPDDRAAWRALDELIALCDELGPRGLPPGALREFGRLYRRVTTHLARARSLDAEPAVIEFLNDLAARAHARIYRPRSRGAGHVWRFLTVDFPATFRQTRRYTLVAAALVLLPATAAFVAVFVYPESAPALLPEVMVRHAENAIKYEQLGLGASESDPAALSSQIMTNNMRVAFLAFGLGVTAGIGTALVLIANGVLVGALAGLFAHHGAALPFWALVLPHGIIEMAAIFIAGGAGLRLGFALIDPGEHNRRDAIVLAAREAGQLVLGVLPMLALAGLIEGFITPGQAPPALKLAFAALTVPLIALYLTGRRPRGGPQP